jgi:origin recognition complex subunit 4
VPLHAALALLRTRLLRASGELQLSEELELKCWCGGAHAVTARASHAGRSRVVDIVKKTVEDVQNVTNNSLLLVGPRGSGKTLVANRALARLAHQLSGQTVVVRVSGWVHGDEAAGLHALVAQLAAPLLRPGAELPRISQADAMPQVATLLRQHHAEGVTAIFVLDEFDIFATQRGHQKLLYTLMDAVQATACRTAILGISCRSDATELLEKRVRSRFSHRVLGFPAQPLASAGTMLGQLLRLPPQFEHAAFAAAWNSALDEALRPRGRVAVLMPRTLLGLHRHPRAVAQAAFAALAHMAPGAQTLSESALVDGLLSLAACARRASLRCLGPTSLHLLVAAVRQRSMRSREVFTFGALFAEYRTAIASITGKPVAREVAQHAFDALLQLCVFVPADAAALAQSGTGRAAGWLKDHAGYSLSLNDDVVAEAVGDAVNKLTNLGHLLKHESGNAHGGAPAR